MRVLLRRPPLQRAMACRLDIAGSCKGFTLGAHGMLVTAWEADTWGLDGA